MKKLIFALSMTLASTSVFANTNANPAAAQKCVQTAVDVIAKKGNYRGETTTINNVSVFGSNQDHVGYYIDVVVTLRNGASFNQVCEIIMKASNCSYDNNYGCAATLKDLDAH